MLTVMSSIVAEGSGAATGRAGAVRGEVLSPAHPLKNILQRQRFGPLTRQLAVALHDGGALLPFDPPIGVEVFGSDRLCTLKTVHINMQTSAQKYGKE
jgi:hypothetical protein